VDAGVVATAVAEAEAEAEIVSAICKSPEYSMLAHSRTDILHQHVRANSD
jgi:hypothetical protein